MGDPIDTQYHQPTCRHAVHSTQCTYVRFLRIDLTIASHFRVGFHDAKL
jgi:hypothetical protein